MPVRIHPADYAGDVFDLPAAQFAAATVALAVIADRLESMCVLVVSARKPGSDRAGIDQRLLGLQSDIRVASNEAGFNAGWRASWFVIHDGGWADRLALANGEDDPDWNLDTGTGLGRDYGSQSLHEGPNAARTDILTCATAGASEVDLDAIMQMLAEGLSSIGTAQKFLGTLSESIGGRSYHEFVFGAGIRALVDADMDEQSTRIAALDIQQKLFVQPLSIANDNAAIILGLLG